MSKFCYWTSVLLPRHPLFLAHFITFNCPFAAANLQVSSFQGHLLFWPTLSPQDVLKMRFATSILIPRIHSLSPTVAPQDFHVVPLLNKYSYTKGIHSLWPTLLLCPFIAANLIVLIPTASILSGPLQHFQMSIVCSTCTSILIPRASMVSGPLEHLKLSIQCCFPTSISKDIPCLSPFQHFKMSIICSTGGGFFIPRTSILSDPLNHCNLSR